MGQGNIAHARQLKRSRPRLSNLPRLRQSGFDQFAEKMDDHLVCLLNACSCRVSYDQIDRGDSPTSTSVSAKDRNRMKVQSFRSFEGATYVLRVSTGRERDEDISRCSKSDHLRRQIS